MTATVPQQRTLTDRLARGLKVNSAPELGPLVHHTASQRRPFQRWLRYREAFDPALVGLGAALLSRPPERIVDPFCGSGTTLMGANDLGADAVGFEVNPVLVELTRAKIATYDSASLRKIQAAVRDFDSLGPDWPSSPTPSTPIVARFFRPEILSALLAAHAYIKRASAGTVRDFLLTGWLSALEGVSNVFREGNGVKYRNRLRTPSGYRSIAWEETPAYRAEPYPLVREALRERYRMMIEDVVGRRASRPKGASELYQDSALHVSLVMSPHSADMAIFSPPYCNNFNYTKMFQLELWMGQFVRSRAEMQVLSRQAIRSHVEIPSEFGPEVVLPTELLEVCNWIESRELWSPKIPQTIKAYFADMSVALGGLYEVLRPGGICQIIVGNSAYAGVVVPTDLLLGRIAEAIGFVVKDIQVARPLVTSSQQRHLIGDMSVLLRESVVTLVRS